MHATEPAIFLDRDNTLIRNDGDLGDPALVELFDGVAAGLSALRAAGYRLVVVTNQGGVARGRYSEDDVDAVHQRIARLVDAEAGERDLIDRFYYCPYHPDAELDEYRREHFWRKPQPGMLLQAARDMKLDLAACWMIGDAARDAEAGANAGCRTVLLARADEADARLQGSPARPTVIASTFTDAVQAILDRTPDTVSMAARTSGNADSQDGASLADPGDSATRAPVSAGGLSTGPDTGSTLEQAAGVEILRGAIQQLSDELRDERMRGVEFGGMRLAAGLGILLSMLLAVLGLLQLGSEGAFERWILGALLVQLMSIAILLFDNRS